MGDTKDSLEGLRPEKDFFIGLDSDGCVFDSMDIKHKECFCPAFIDHSPPYSPCSISPAWGLRKIPT